MDNNSTQNLEDIKDYEIAIKALEEFEKDPITYNFEEVLKELEIEIQ